jgi:hypothetical protein
MKKTNMLIILILSLGLMLTACGSEDKNNNNSIYVPPLLTSSSQSIIDPLSVEKCFDGIDNDGDALIDEDCNSNFVAVGNDGIIIHSDNGTDWKVDESKLGTGKNLMDIASGPGNWVAVGSDYSDGFVIKYDVATGLQTTDLSSLDIDSLNGIAYGTTLDGKGKWVAVGTGDSQGIIADSDDGVAWTTKRREATERYYDVVYGNGIWIVVGSKGPTQGIVKSSDDWDTVVGNTKDIPLYDVAYDGVDKWFARGLDSASGNLIWDTVIIEFKIDWSIENKVTIENTYLNDLASDGNGNLMAVGEDYQGNGIAVISNDWTDLIQASDDNLMGVVYDGGENWIAVGTNGTIVTMPTSTPSVISNDISVTDKVLKAIGVKL